MSLFARIKTFIGNLRLRERMLLYIHCRRNSADSAVGYLYLSEYEIGVDQKAKESEMDGLNMIADSMSESMSVISDISKQMYF